MIITCPSCSGRFQYDEARFQGVPSKRFKCPKCQHIFEVENPEFLAALAELAPPPPPVPEASPIQATTQLPRQEPSESVRETTARKDRSAMLSAAGLRNGLPTGFRFSLAFLSGAMASTVRQLDKPQILIGREDGDIVTMDPETSRRHAMIEIHPDGTVWLEDLGSTNGTTTEGQPVTGQIQLHDRQEFTCGQSTFMLLVRKSDGMLD
ncbi:FHA domain-containing protein [Holophaga foetida]|uniref:FHA domain-containing protein n=1 Tax=Holophaga foetida TaxID=35839 RepID=UPI00024749E9|nr:FHA domain-containing protein [Holophaga foetida]